MTNIITNMLDTITNGTNIYSQHQIIQTIIEKNTITSWSDPALWVTIAGSIIGAGLTICGLYIARRGVKNWEVDTIHKLRMEYVTIRNIWFKEKKENLLTEERKIELITDLCNIMEKVCILIVKKYIDEELAFRSFERALIQGMEYGKDKEFYDKHKDAYNATRIIYERWKHISKK